MGLFDEKRPNYNEGSPSLGSTRKIEPERPTPTREAFEKMKAAADAALEKKLQMRRRGEIIKQNMIRDRLEQSKDCATTEHALMVLDDPKIKQILTIDNRPAEKLVTRKARRLKREKSGGLSL